ncbi:MAG: hypothetical protein FJY65_06015, partial [Calditrichaeota bacterium]|nr:hypothetical protein [Calditrichota bacterium]
KSKQPPLRSVLFICTANMTRSPAAEALFKRMAQESGENWTIGSAGLQARASSPVYRIIYNYFLERYKINLSQHRSRRVDKRMLAQYRWIFAMEEAQRLKLIAIAPHMSDRIFTLRNFARQEPLDNPDVPDPTLINDERNYDITINLVNILEAEIARIFKALQTKVADLEWQPE